MAVGLAPDHQSQEPINQAGICIGATHGNIGHDADVPVPDNLHELHHRVGLSSERLDSRAIRFSFRLTGRADRFGLAMSTQAHSFRLAGRLFDLSICLKLGNVHALLRADNLVLNIGERSLPHELLALLLRSFLHFVGFALFLSDFAIRLGLR